MLIQTWVVAGARQGPGKDRVSAPPGQVPCVPALAPGVLLAFSDLGSERETCGFFWRGGAGFTFS